MDSRLNEALTAQWQYIDSDLRVWRIPSTNSKSKKVRSVPLNDSAIDVLDQLDTEKSFEHLFIKGKTGKPYTTIYKLWISLVKMWDGHTFGCTTCVISTRPSWATSVGACMRSSRSSAIQIQRSPSGMPTFPQRRCRMPPTVLPTLSTVRWAGQPGSWKCAEDTGKDALSSRS